MSELGSASANHSDEVIKWVKLSSTGKCVKLYTVIQLAAFSASLCAPLPEPGLTMECGRWRWTPLILSLLTSTGMCVVILHYLVDGFSRIQPRRQEQQHDRENGNQWNHPLFSTYRSLRNVCCWLVSTYKSLRDGCCWLLQSAAILVTFLAVSITSLHHVCFADVED